MISFYTGAYLTNKGSIKMLSPNARQNLNQGKKKKFFLKTRKQLNFAHDDFLYNSYQ